MSRPAFAVLSHLLVDPRLRLVLLGLHPALPAHPLVLVKLFLVIEEPIVGNAFAGLAQGEDSPWIMAFFQSPPIHMVKDLGSVRTPLRGAEATIPSLEPELRVGGHVSARILPHRRSALGARYPGARRARFLFKHLFLAGDRILVKRLFLAGGRLYLQPQLVGCGQGHRRVGRVDAVTGPEGREKGQDSFPVPCFVGTRGIAPKSLPRLLTILPFLLLPSLASFLGTLERGQVQG